MRRPQALRTAEPLVALESPHRASTQALISYLDQVQRREPAPTLITVIVPEIRPTRCWRPFVHNYLAWRLKWVCLFRPGTVVTSIPYTVRE